MAAVLAVVALVGGRRLVRIVDASIGMYLLRRALGHSTLNRAERARDADEAAAAADGFEIGPEQLAARLGLPGARSGSTAAAPPPARQAAPRTAPAAARPLPIGDAAYRARLERAAAASRSSVGTRRPAPPAFALRPSAIARARVDRRAGAGTRLRLVRDAAVAVVLVAALVALGSALARPPDGGVLSATATPAPTASPSLAPATGPTPPP